MHLRVPLSGIGARAALTAAPLDVDFAGVPSGTPASVTLTSTGEAPVDVSVALKGSVSGPPT